MTSAEATPAPKRALLLAPPTDASGRLDAKALQSLALHLGAAAGRRYRLATPCSGQRCPPVDRLTLEVSADGPSCRLELLLIAPPLLPRRVTSISAACSAAALRGPLDEAMKRLLPSGGGEAESAHAEKPRRAPKGTASPKTGGGEEPAGLGPDDPDRRPRSSSAAPYDGSSTPAAASQPATPFIRDRATLTLGLALLSWHATVSPFGKEPSTLSDVDTALAFSTEIFPAGGRNDAWADLGLALRYVRAFGPDLQWLEAGPCFRWNPHKVSGGLELAGSIGWGYQRDLLVGHLDLHYLRFGAQGFLPFVRHRAWWLGLRAEATLLLLLPVVDVATAAVGVDARLGLLFSYWGVSVRLEAFLRLIGFDLTEPTGGNAMPYQESNIGGLLSLGYAI